MLGTPFRRGQSTSTVRHFTKDFSLMPAFRFFFPALVAIVLVLAISDRGFAQSPAGRWRGEWVSQSTGHRGPMRANIRPTGPSTYSARFSGRFFVVFPFTYRVELVSNGCGHYSAEKKLGPLLGSYRMQTYFGSSSMSGRFQAAKDIGSVRMSRAGQ
jgi:hypothetical protein